MRDYIMQEMLEAVLKSAVITAALLTMWVCFTACTNASGTARLDAAIRAGEFAACETDCNIVDRARSLGLDLDALHAEGVMPF